MVGIRRRRAVVRFVYYLVVIVKAPELINRIEVGNTLGEGVIWDHRSEVVWWTDIECCRLYRYSPATAQLNHWSTPQRLCSFGLTGASDTLIAAFADGFAYYSPATGELQWLHQLKQPGNMRMNDGRVDRQGRFWAGGMVENPGNGESSMASLYRLDLDCLSRCENNILISNSLCWSPDSTRMYFADSARRTIYSYCFDAVMGTASHREVFAQTPQGIYPDGSTVDSEGFLWNAQWGGSRVVRYTPDGDIDRIVEVAVSQPSCVAFGGPELNQLLVTSASQGLGRCQLKNDLLAGDLLIYQTDISGIAECIYKT